VTRRLVTASVWGGALALVVLASRAVAYALAPSTLLSLELRRSAGGPRLVIVAAVALGLAALASTAAVGLAALALRERLALEPRLDVPRPRLRPAAFRFAALWAASSLVFAYLESYLHWRAGLGWHGLHCLTGPVHRNAIPILGAFSLLAVALNLCGEHLVAWVRRTLRRLGPAPRRVRIRRRLVPLPALPLPGRAPLLLRPRGPPAAFRVVP
jgi:hypothetical protein